ncbi:transcription factor E2F3-like [Xiphias gladius]|uniref:transcription factor E2F3-like n=1 Tax=Xiphias gladius TaxID=8245 RepID=UPI001A9966B4|nr:transcription factor E2F3-like [Xiphias gladius]
MVKCVVSGCPNRTVNVNRGILHRPPKRFFNFPKDPARVKVWLAALRETDKQEATDQHLICEDHFLPEDISASGVNSDAIPIMPPYLDGPLGLISPWGAESSEEEEEEEEEEEQRQQEQQEQQQQSAAIGCEEDDVDDDAGGDDTSAAPRPPAPDPPQQDPGGGLENPPGTEKTSAALPQRKRSIQSKKVSRQDVSLGLLTRGFLELLLAAPDGSLDLRQVATSLQTRKRRVYDITNVLDGINLIQKESANRIKWTGKSPISNFLWKNQQRFQRELENLKLVEDTLDGLIKSCAQQLFEMTDDVENSAWAYVTHEDISGLRALQGQTVVVIKAPEETKLEIPAPKEDSIQVHLKAGKGPIMVVTCEVESGDAVTSDPGETGRGFFLTLEESRIRTTALHTESCGPQSTVQSA